MESEINVLISYRLERAYESLGEAKVLLEKNYINTFVNRIYYACFYAVNALLLTKDFSSAKHSGVRSFFHEKFVKCGVVGVELGQFYDKLFRNRQKCDYADLVRFNIDEVRFWYDDAEKFVKTIDGIIKSVTTVTNNFS